MFRIPVKLITSNVIKVNARLTGSVRALATPPGLAEPPSSSSSSSVPPKKSRIGTKLIIALLGATSITTAMLVYAKSNDDFRNLLKDYAPWTDDAIALMYEERVMPGSWVLSVAKDFGASVNTMIFGDSSEPKKAPETPKPALKKVDILAPVQAPKPLKERVQIQEPKQATILKTIAETPKLPEIKVPMPVLPVMASITSSVNDDEDKAVIEEAASAARSAYKRATVALNEYARDINTVMESCQEGGTGKGPWEDLKRSTAAREVAENDAEAAAKVLDEFGGANGQRARSELSSVKVAYEKAKTSAAVAQRYWPQVERARQHFVDELEVLFPRADISSGRLDTRGGDPDALLLLALRRVVLYQQLLAKQDVVLSNKVDQALRGTDEDVIRAKVDLELEKERRELAIMYQKKMLASQLDSERETAEQLKRQLEIHTMHLQGALDHRAEEVSQHERALAEERAANERAAHGLRLAAVLGRLQGVDDALKARSDADKMARQSQVLWAASEALEGALRSGESHKLRTPLALELDAIAAAAAESDELVAAVLRGFPAVAREKGVLSEVALRDRFIKVEKVCRSVALVPEHGARLPVFLLSWLQGLLLAKASNPTLAELDDQPTDFSQLDTYDILQRARYWVERGQWAQALRYIQLLSGAPRAVARDWAKEATLHLEARQAARALLAHASATGLLHL